MKNFAMQQIFAMRNDMDDKSYVFAKGVADGKEAYAFVLDKGIYQSTSKEEMTEIFNALRREGWKLLPTRTVEEPKVEKAPKDTTKARRGRRPKTEAPKAPKDKVPPMWLFPKKEGRRKVYAAENFDIDAYKAKAAELGLLTAKGKVLPENREKVYIALGAKKNPEREAYDKAKEVK